MPNEPVKEWVLPALIPFAELKTKDLEECVYWLLDAMGAKDLEWRLGGAGGGAADGGRDLEAHFYTPSADNEIESQRWWIECKGRTGTVEPQEVKDAIVNAEAKRQLDYIVIATNTQFSNPTRDWVKEWQLTHDRPKVKLWDHAHLERLLSRHPDVVLRLFSEALSLKGRYQAMESRFWNKLEFVSSRALSDRWKGREDIGATAMGTFAAIVNEFANGNITYRPWGAILSRKSLIDVLRTSLVNVSYLLIRSTKGGIDQKPICRAFSYLILCALALFPAEDVAQLVTDAVYCRFPEEIPEFAQEYLLMPIANQLLSEIQDVCSSDCHRISTIRTALTEDKDEVDDYWRRLDRQGVDEPTSRSFVRIELRDAPCNVGFPVGKDHDCPLFAHKASVKNFAELLTTIKTVAAFRRAQAVEKRKAEREHGHRTGSDT